MISDSFNTHTNRRLSCKFICIKCIVFANERKKHKVKRNNFFISDIRVDKSTWNEINALCDYVTETTYM